MLRISFQVSHSHTSSAESAVDPCLIQAPAQQGVDQAAPEVLLPQLHKHLRSLLNPLVEQGLKLPVDGAVASERFVLIDGLRVAATPVEQVDALLFEQDQPSARPARGSDYSKSRVSGEHPALPPDELA